MIVGDNDTNCDLRECLGRQYDVGEARRRRVLEQMTGFGPDLVLLDVMMPGIDGFETCRRIRQTPGGDLTQIVLVSAKSSTDARLAGYEAGADDYITKPFEPEELLAKVRVLFRLRKTMLELAAIRSQLTLQNDRLADMVRERTQEVVATRDVTVFALANWPNHATETGEHLERMRSYSQISPSAWPEGPYTEQIDDLFLENLWRSSPLHDVGKVGCPT